MAVHQGHGPLISFNLLGGAWAILQHHGWFAAGLFFKVTAMAQAPNCQAVHSGHLVCHRAILTHAQHNTPTPLPLASKSPLRPAVPSESSPGPAVPSNSSPSNSSPCKILDQLCLAILSLDQLCLCSPRTARCQQTTTTPDCKHKQAGICCLP